MKILLFLGITVCSLQVLGQSRWLSGTITDATTHEPLRNASVTSKPDNKGVRTDSLGRFRLPVGDGKVTLVVSMIGYAQKTIGSNSISTYYSGSSAQGNLNITLVADAKRLDEVVVTNKRGKYRNKNNPAVDLIRKVVEEKENNRPESFDNVSYEEYDKVEISLRDIDRKKLNRKLLKPYNFLFEHPDTLAGEDTSLLYPVYLEEKLSNNYLQKKPVRSKQVIIADKKVDFGDLIDAKGMSDYVNTLLADVDIYDNNVLLFTNQFLSPISNAAPAFYEFYLGDTVVYNGERLVRLNFIPRNPDDLLFRGMFYITLDGRYAVTKVALTISKKANLNFIRNLHIDQEFIKTADGHYYRVRSDESADFSLLAKKKGIHGRKLVSYSKLVTDQAISESVFTGGVSDSLTAAAQSRSDSFWTDRRHEALSAGESRVYENIDSLRHMRSFIRTKDLINLFIAGYKSVGKKFELGPANTFYSFNPVEGLRLRLGGRTTPGFSKRIWLEGYGAYGFNDRRWKYDAGIAYSFNKLSDYGYPLHYIKAAFMHDVKIPGQELQFVQDNSFLLSFNRGKNDKWLYNDIFRLDYVKELANHLSYGLGFKYWAQQPAGSIRYIQAKSSGLDTVSNISTSQVSAQIRWAPHEQFYQGRVYRIPYPNKYPIISLQYIAGIKGLFGGEYAYQNLNLSLFKRCYLSTLGYTDINLTGTYISGRLPFPLLAIVPANQTYIYSANSYNLMNFLEFVSDHYAGVDVEHHFNGFIFNKVPFLKRLKLREILTAKVLYGGLRAENDPAKDAQLVKFPLLDGQASTFALGNQPYIEAGFAIGNIFKFLRVDAIERFSYLDHPLVPRYGIRLQLKFDY